MPRFMTRPEMLVDAFLEIGYITQAGISIRYGIKLSSVSSLVSRARKLMPRGRQIEFIGGKYRLVKDYTFCKVEKQLKLRRAG